MNINPRFASSSPAPFTADQAKAYSKPGPQGKLSEAFVSFLNDKRDEFQWSDERLVVAIRAHDTTTDGVLVRHWFRQFRASGQAWSV